MLPSNAGCTAPGVVRRRRSTNSNGCLLVLACLRADHRQLPEHLRTVPRVFSQTALAPPRDDLRAARLLSAACRRRADPVARDEMARAGLN